MRFILTLIAAALAAAFMPAAPQGAATGDRAARTAGVCVDTAALARMGRAVRITVDEATGELVIRLDVTPPAAGG